MIFPCAFALCDHEQKVNLQLVSEGPMKVLVWSSWGLLYAYQRCCLKKCDSPFGPQETSRGTWIVTPMAMTHSRLSRALPVQLMTRHLPSRVPILLAGVKTIGMLEPILLLDNTPRCKSHDKEGKSNMGFDGFYNMPHIFHLQPL